MRLLWLLSQVSVWRLILAIVASVASGVATMGSIICVLESLRSGNMLWWQFILIAGFAVLCRIYSRATLNQLSARSIVRLRRRLVRSVLHVPLRDLERIGSARLVVAFTSDLAIIGSAVRNFVSLFSNAAFLVACLSYLAWLSPVKMAITAALVLLCIAGAVLLRRLERTPAHLFRETWDQIVHVYKTMLDGLKELKLNRALAFQVLRHFEDRVRDLQVHAGDRARYSDGVATWVQAMFFVILGVAVFSPFGEDPHRTLGYGLLALLYMRSPLRSLISDSGGFADASVALQRITDLGLTLSEDHERDSTQRVPVPSQDWRSLTLRDVVFRYEEGHPDDDFGLGPLDITLNRGELVFIAGGNGSGKTTLVKVLTGLYAPTRGTIEFNGVAVNEENIRWYRSKFSVVFADFCLFEGIADLQYENLNIEAERLAIRLKLKRWMLEPRQPSDVSTALSAGERRRAALLTALLEDRPIFVFDEWAADQDPQFKEIFYREILPSIRDRGKLVIVLSHDERYFHVADRVLWLERGEPPTWRSPFSFEESSAAMSGAPGKPMGVAAATET